MKTDTTDEIGGLNPPIGDLPYKDPSDNCLTGEIKWRYLSHMDSTGSIVQSANSCLLGQANSSGNERGSGRENSSGEVSAVGAYPTVLLLEDDPDVSTRIAQALSEGDYRTLAASQVETVFSLVQKRQVAVVLLNWRLLTRLGGSGLIDELRRRSPHSHLPMIVISAEHSELMEASQLGIDDYVPNPFRADDLLHVVDEHCR